jgi:hypothetical protein
VLCGGVVHGLTENDVVGLFIYGSLIHFVYRVCGSEASALCGDQYAVHCNSSLLVAV